jgi:Trypsin
LTTDPDCDGCPEAVDYEIEEKFVHPEYTRKNRMSKGIALLRLSKAVDIEKSKYVTTICLPLKKENSLVTTPTPTFYNIGFRRTERSSNPTVMLKTRESYVTPEICNEVYKRLVKTIEEFHLCTESEEKGSCTGNQHIF